MNPIFKISVWIAAATLTSASVFAEETQTTPGEEAVFKGNLVVVPTVTSSPGFGNGGGLMGMYFLKPKPEHNAPNSSLIAIAQYSDTDSYFMGLFAGFYSKNDLWRTNPGLLRGRMNSDLNIQGFGNVRYANDVRGAVYRQQRRIVDPWYGGVTFQIIDSKYTAKNEEALQYFEAADIEDTTTIKPGLVLSYDTREHQHYPRAGQQGELSVSYSPDGLNQEKAYSSVEGFLSSFHQVGQRQVFAAKLNGKTVSSNAPYFEKPTLGQRGDLRGYTPGEIVGDTLLSLQGEWRSFFHPLIGGVLFAGGAGLWGGDGESFTRDDIYWSYGLGLRIRLQAKNRINFRIDYAWGEEDQDGFYIGMQEAF